MLENLKLAENYRDMALNEPEEYQRHVFRLAARCVDIQKSRILQMQQEMHNNSLHSLWKFHTPTWEE